jgi:cellulose synthase/poly-beta-1,6-N-acetylglucosamine synthase-like glycosyltransferase
MHNSFLIIFCCSLFLILHTYLFYPISMLLLFSKVKNRLTNFSENEELPNVSILIAAYNEENVIEKKILSVFNTTYPLSKIKVYVGSDASTDKTESIITSLQQTYHNLHLVKFEGRVGKIGIINHLQSLVQDELLILTDANVMFNTQTIFELIKNFKSQGVGVVAANIIKESDNNEGISFQEKKYLSIENKIKACESNAFKLLMGAEGGCYALRNNLFSKIPPNFIVDDFFITLEVLNKNKFAIFNTEAICIEDVSNDTDGEYKRKVRISSGNFQNLFYFKKNLIQFWKPLCFAFWSHKVLRWLTPFLLILCFTCSFFLMGFYSGFVYLFVLQLFGFLVPLINHFFKFNSRLLKFVSHFYLMNIALFEGFIKYTAGIKTNIWQPIKRNV